MIKFILSLFLICFLIEVRAQVENTPKIKDEYFNFVNLAKVCERLQTKYGIQIDVAKDVPMDEKISYWFSNISAAKGIQQALKGTSLVSFTDDDGVIHILLKSAKLNLNDFKFAKKSPKNPEKEIFE